MFQFTKVQGFAVALTAILATSVLAAPSATASVPEVKPGPGLPSLASLNLTSADLYAMGPPPALSSDGLGTRSADYTAVCQTYSTAAVNDVIACFNYLVNIGNNACGVSGDNVEFCEAGTAGIGGSNISGGPSASSSCYDVALAVQWIFTYCNVDGNVGGSDAAYGNGYLIVTVDNENWF